MERLNRKVRGYIYIYIILYIYIYIYITHRNCIGFNLNAEVYGGVGMALCIIHAHVHRHARQAHRASIAIADIDSRLDVGEVDERYSLSTVEEPRAGRSRGRVMYSWDRQCGGHVGYRSQLDRTRLRPPACWPSRPSTISAPSRSLPGPIMKRWRGHKTSAPVETMEWLSAGNAKGLPAVNPGVKMSVTKCQALPQAFESLPYRPISVPCLARFPPATRSRGSLFFSKT